jgi:hypothetical protein
MLAPGEKSLEALAQKFLAKNFDPGAPVPTDWYRELLGFPTDTQIAVESRGNSAKAIAEAKRVNLDFHKALARLQDYLLEHHGVLVDNVHSKGYAIISPQSQLGVIYNKGMRSATKAVATAIKRTGHIRVGESNLVEQSRIRDARGRLLMIQEAIRKQKRSGSVE